MKHYSTICGVELGFDSDSIKEARACKLKNRRVMLCHDGKNYVLQWKNLQRDGTICGQNLGFTPEAMEAIVEMFFLMNGPRVAMKSLTLCQLPNAEADRAAEDEG